jgi:hypothetical protein
MGELKKITMNFSNDALIGEGSYNNVYLGVLKDGQRSAIKKPRHTRGTTFKVTAVCCLCYPFSYCSQIITSTTSLSVPPLSLSLSLSAGFRHLKIQTCECYPASWILC